MKLLLRFGRFGLGSAAVFGTLRVDAQTPPSAATQPPIRSAGSSPIPDAIDSLARSFSGGDSAPVCRISGEDWNGAPTTGCNWLVPGKLSATAGVDSVLTSRIPRDGGMVAYFRTMPGAAEMTRFADSLDLAMKARGLVPLDCGGGQTPAGQMRARVWEDKNLIVHLATYAPPPGIYKVTVMAIDHPDQFPPVACRTRK